MRIFGCLAAIVIAPFVLNTDHSLRSLLSASTSSLFTISSDSLARSARRSDRMNTNRCCVPSAQLLSEQPREHS
jgi:hypothetical protein